MFIKTPYKVLVAGTDVTSRFDPLLLSIDISRASGEAADSCSLNLSDPDGRIKLPRERDPILIQIRNQQAFSGFTSDVEYDFDKGGGRKLTVSASSIDQGGKVKEPVLRSADNKKFPDVAKQWGQKAGLNVRVAGSIADIDRDYWIMQNESFMAWGRRISAEIGASFKVIGSDAYFVSLNEGISISGKTLTPIQARYGGNLISGKISPIIGRPKFKDVELSYFDIAKGEHVKVKVETGIEDVDASLRTVIQSANESQARDKAGAAGKESDREKGSGSITILGDVLAEPEAICAVSGIRPGIDGSYRISSVGHKLSRSGFTSDLGLKQPQDGAGKDTRGEKTPAASGATVPAGSEAGIPTVGGNVA